LKPAAGSCVTGLPPAASALNSLFLSLDMVVTPSRASVFLG
jgi:hypothetical protein